MNFVVTVLLTVLVFGIIINIHELGHFCAAKLFRVRVNEFSFGMGPKLLSRKGKETTYSLRVFPIGGYVAMEGEDEESADERAFGAKPAWQRFIILVAGAGMNLLLGLLISAFLATQMNLIPTTMLAEVGTRETGENLQITDQIVSVNGYRTPGYDDVVFQLVRDKDGVVDLEILRGEGKEKVSIPGYAFNMIEGEDGRRSLDLDLRFYGQEKTFGNVLSYTFQWTGSTIKQVWYSLLDILGGQYSLADISGPVGTAVVIQEAASYGLRAFMGIFAFITINVGIFNLLPIPALDGGRILFLLVEIIRRKPVPQKYETWITAGGLILMLGLMAVVSVKDIVQVVGKLFN